MRPGRPLGRPPVGETSVPIHRDWAAEALAEHAAGPLRTTVPCEVTALRLGPVALLFAPLEVFVETGLALKAASPALVTLLATNANGELGYLPTREAYGVDDYTNPQGLAPRVYRMFAEAAEPLFPERAGALRRVVCPMTVTASASLLEIEPTVFFTRAADGVLRQLVYIHVDNRGAGWLAVGCARWL
jgi:hypothetical protein